MDIFSQTTLPVLEQVVQFAQRRQAVLAGNLANLDTPGYRVRDLSPEKFQHRLREALAQRDRPASPGASLTSATNERGLQHVTRDMEGLLYHDDSNGSLEHQVTEISKNQMLHNTALAIMGNQFRLLQSAISERV